VTGPSKGQAVRLTSMALPPDLRWLNDLLDLLVDEYVDRLAAQDAKMQMADQPRPTLSKAAK
jgi:hypothetical protein